MKSIAKIMLHCLLINSMSNVSGIEMSNSMYEYLEKTCHGIAYGALSNSEVNSEKSVDFLDKMDFFAKVILEVTEHEKRECMPANMLMPTEEELAYGAALYLKSSDPILFFLNHNILPEGGRWCGYDLITYLVHFGQTPNENNGKPEAHKNAVLERMRLLINHGVPYNLTNDVRNETPLNRARRCFDELQICCSPTHPLRLDPESTRVSSYGQDITILSAFLSEAITILEEAPSQTKCHKALQLMQSAGGRVLPYDVEDHIATFVVQNEK